MSSTASRLSISADAARAVGRQADDHDSKVTNAAANVIAE
jgi:hypothetical protein